VHRVTLIISAVSDKGVWQLSDRRLMDPQTGQVVTDTATKVIRLELSNAKVCIGYSGVGSVADQEISQWLKRLFRGRRMTYREARNMLAASATKRLTPHVGAVHEFSLVAIVEGRPHIEIIAADRNQKLWESTTVPSGQFGSWSPQGQILRGVYFSGSARESLKRKDRRIAVRTLKRKTVGSEQMEAELVHLHRIAYSSANPPTISSDCISTHIDEHGGGWSRLYTPTGMRTISIPTVSSGLPVDEIADVIVRIEGPVLKRALKRGQKASPKTDAINEALRRIDTTPDDSLPWRT